MKQLLLTGAAALAMTFGAVAAQAGGASGGSPPPSDPCALDPDSCDIGGGESDPGAGGGGSGGGTPGSGGGTPAAPVSYGYGTGAMLFTLDSLPTGASGSRAFYQPYQDNSAFGLPPIDSAQGVLTETVAGTTVSFRTDDFVLGTSPAQTRIGVGNDSSFFPYLGVPTGVQVGITAATFSATPPGAIYANFSTALSYFSINLYRLSGAFDVSSTITAYSGLNGTGTVLGSISGLISGGNNFDYRTLALANLGGARSFAIQGGSALANYDDITATAARGAVPEPASWAMMLAGFGLLGGAMRRRTRVVFG